MTGTPTLYAAGLIVAVQGFRVARLAYDAYRGGRFIAVIGWGFGAACTFIVAVGTIRSA